MKIERRSFELVQLRAAADEGKKPIIKGHAAVFNKWTEDFWGFKERVAPGAFANTIKNSDVRALLNHDPNFVLGRSVNGSLRMEEDKKGLLVEIDPPGTQWANDLLVTIERGDISQMSIAFTIVKEEWEAKGKENLRTLTEVELYDVSPVTFPAYPQTDVGVRELFRSEGLDFQAMARVMTRSERKLQLTDDDHSTIRASISFLSKLLPVAQERTEPTEIPIPHVRSLTILRKRLELAALTNSL